MAQTWLGSGLLTSAGAAPHDIQARSVKTTSPSEAGTARPAGDPLREYLLACPELARLCSQNGWIDNDTLEAEVLEQGQDTVLLAVTFEEVIMEGAGCIAGRVPCYGRVRVRLDARGRIESIQVV